MVQNANAPAGRGRRLPPGVVDSARAPARLLAAGVPLGPLRLVETVGRRSGRPRVVPVVTVRHRGARWLVSPFGDTAWVLNVRANGEARLGRRRRRPVRLTEVDGELRVAVLRRYRRAYRAVGYVRTAFAGTPLADDAAMRHHAVRHPVFRIDAVGSADPSRKERS